MSDQLEVEPKPEVENDSDFYISRVSKAKVKARAAIYYQKNKEVMNEKRKALYAANPKIREDTCRRTAISRARNRVLSVKVECEGCGQILHPRSMENHLTTKTHLIKSAYRRVKSINELNALIECCEGYPQRAGSQCEGCGNMV